MDDIAGKLSEILSDPASMQQIQSMMNSLNLGGASGQAGGDPPPAGSAIDPSMLQGLMQAMGGTGGQAGGNSPSSGSAIDPSMLQGLMNAMGGKAGHASGSTAPPAQNADASSSPLGGMDLSALSGLLSGFQGGSPAGNAHTPAQNAGVSSAPDQNAQMVQMMTAFSRMAPLMQQLNQEDDSTRLLYALRPMLSPARQTKLDEAVKLMRMMRMMPLLKDSGMLSSLLKG